MCKHCHHEVGTTEISGHLENAAVNIVTALGDYARCLDINLVEKDADEITYFQQIRHVLNNPSPLFVNRLAENNWESKSELRDLFRKHPNWDEKLQAFWVKGVCTQEPDYALLDDLLLELGLQGSESRLKDIRKKLPNTPSNVTESQIIIAAGWFSAPRVDDDADPHLQMLKKVAPKAWRVDKSRTKIFKDFCKALGFMTKEKGNTFEKTYSRIIEILHPHKIAFKLYVSINPAHFLTMSNPNYDARGSFMTSCHSLTNAEFTHSAGCAGYARDRFSFIAFTVADDENLTTFNSRKTTRQIFAYEPNNGVLLQSRLYTSKSGDSYGGVNGDTPTGRAYREILMSTIAELENAPDKWDVQKYTKNTYGIEIEAHDTFGGYPDWYYGDMGARLAVREDCKETCKEFRIGDMGLCFTCGKPIRNGIICRPCLSELECYECGKYSDELAEVISTYGEVKYVCPDCLEKKYFHCPICGEYHPTSEANYVYGIGEVCEKCTGEFIECDYCGRLCPLDEITEVGGELFCEDCFNAKCGLCEECGEYFHRDECRLAYDSRGYDTLLCENCAQEFETCAKCGAYIYLMHGETPHVNKDGEHICQNCYDSKNNNSTSESETF